jgi:hypothetical protein
MLTVLGATVLVAKAQQFKRHHTGFSSLAT